MTSHLPSKAWWKEAVVYQIYPSSFKDSNGDGIGDLKGITEKAEYLGSLGIDCVWLSPIFTSPQKDMGYDISNYEDIDPIYGNMRDFEEMRDALKAQGIKIVLDLVVNHSSDQHEWFKQSRKSKDNDKRNYYFWRPARYIDGKRTPPNNWASFFGGSAWTWCDKTEEYYLALFAPEQPDLNWENPVVRTEVHSILQYWLDRGCDGYRMDVITFISKEPGLPDVEIVDPSRFEQPATSMFANGPRVHEYIREFNDKVLSKYDCITVGEAQRCTNEEALDYILPERHELKEIFSFTLHGMDGTGHPYSYRKWTLPEFKKILSDLQVLMYDKGGWNSVFFENHDQPRSVTRYADSSDEWRVQSAKAMAMLETTLGGTLYVYQGQEIGMRNIPPSWPISEYKDIMTVNAWADYEEHAKTLGEAEGKKYLAEQKAMLQLKARDHARTPMQWTSGPQAGFTEASVEPWMRVNDDYVTVNVEAQQEEKSSVLAFWRKMLKLRSGMKDVLVYGNHRQLQAKDLDVFVYIRSYQDRHALVAINFSTKELTCELEPSDLPKADFELHTSTYGDLSSPDHHKITLRPWEGKLFTNK